MGISIRLAGPDDAQLIHRFVRLLADYEREPEAVRATVEDFREQLSRVHPPFECLIAEVDGEPAGFAVYCQNYSTWRGRPGLWLEDLFVAPGRRGLGIGRALLARLAATARERGCARCEWNVLDWNEPALDFYRSIGAVALDQWTVHRLDDVALDRLADEGDGRR